MSKIDEPMDFMDEVNKLSFGEKAVDPIYQILIDHRHTSRDTLAKEFRALMKSERKRELDFLSHAIKNRPKYSFATSPNGGDVVRYIDDRKKQIDGEKFEYDIRTHVGWPSIEGEQS